MPAKSDRKQLNKQRKPRKAEHKQTAKPPRQVQHAPHRAQRRRTLAPPRSVTRLTGAPFSRGLVHPTTVNFTGEHHRRVLENGSVLRMTLEDGPVAVTAMDMNREIKLSTQPNGDLKISFSMPMCDVLSLVSAYPIGGCLAAVDALGSGVQYSGGTILLNPMVNQIIAYGETAPQIGMVAYNSPQLGLQSLAYSKYKLNRLGFAYQPQGQTFQATSQMLAESRMRFSFTGDPTHPIIGMLGYRGTGTIDYSILTETPNSVQFSEWNAWSLDIRDFHTDWLTINTPRFVPTTLTFGTGDIAETRQACFGAISCYDSYLSASDRVVMPHGQLWINGEILFSDPSPLLYAYVPPQMRALVSALGALRDSDCKSLSVSTEDKSESKDEKKPTEPDDDEDRVKLVAIDDPDSPEIVSPPRYKALKNSTPGGDKYVPKAKPPSRK
jgi:hypothetical protein